MTDNVKELITFTNSIKELVELRNFIFRTQDKKKDTLLLRLSGLFDSAVYRYKLDFPVPEDHEWIKQLSLSDKLDYCRHYVEQYRNLEGQFK